MQSACLEILVERGTTKACQEVESLANSFPDKTWLKNYHVIKARENTRRTSWQPIDPSELKKMIADNSKRIVRDEKELLGVICESLERYQKKCKGETPIAIRLWDKDHTTDLPEPSSGFIDKIENHVLRAWSEFNGYAS